MSRGDCRPRSIRLIVSTASSVRGPGHEDDLKLFLTYVGEVGAEGSALVTLADAVAKRNIKAPAIKLFLIFTRVGRLPVDFAKRVEVVLDAVKGLPHLGLWAEPTGAKTDVVLDMTALALVLRRDRPEYVRERLAAKKAGRRGWYRQKEPKEGGPSSGWPF